MMQKISDEFGYGETPYFRRVRLPFFYSEQAKDGNCMEDMNRTNRTQRCQKGSKTSRAAFMIFLPKKRFGLMEALPHLNEKTIQKVLFAEEHKIEVNVSFFRGDFWSGFRCG
jgi:hypothetical protein